MVTRHEFQQYHRLQSKLESEIADAKKIAGLQEMPDDVWADEDRRMEWIKEDRAQWNFNNSRLAKLQRLYDRCFPKKEWVIEEVEAFFAAEEGPLY